MLARPTLLALVALPAFAQTIYTWEDKDGTHYTDDPSQVPAKARPDAMLLNQPAVKVTNARPLPQADVVIQTTADGKPIDPQPAQPVATQKSPPLLAQPTRREPDEREWRERFITAHRRIETLEKNYVALERSRPQRVECVAQPLVPVGTVQYGSPTTAAPPIVTAPGAQVVTGNGYTTVVGGPNVRQYGPAATCAVNAEYDRITREMELTQVQLSDAKKDLDQLDRQASYDAIPREWRRGW